MKPSLVADSYKIDHYLQYPPGATGVYAYLERRSGAFPDTRFSGLRAILKAEFIRPVTRGDILETREGLARQGAPFNEAGWRRLIEKH